MRNAYDVKIFLDEYTPADSNIGLYADTIGPIGGFNATAGNSRISYPSGYTYLFGSINVGSGIGVPKRFFITDGTNSEVLIAYYATDAYADTTVLKNSYTNATLYTDSYFHWSDVGGSASYPGTFSGDITTPTGVNRVRFIWEPPEGYALSEPDFVGAYIDTVFGELPDIYNFLGRIVYQEITDISAGGDTAYQCDVYTDAKTQDIDIVDFLTINSVYRSLGNGSMITSGGFPAITQGMDTTRGGGFINTTGFSMPVCNTDKLFNTLENAGVSLNGLNALISDVDIDDASDVVRLFDGSVSVDNWSETEYNIVFEPHSENRASYISRQINSEDYPNVPENEEGSCIPAVFGRMKENPALLQITESIDSSYTVTDINATGDLGMLIGVTSDYSVVDRDSFAIDFEASPSVDEDEAANETTIRVILGFDDELTILSATGTVADNVYLKITSNQLTSSDDDYETYQLSVGKYRKIKSITRVDAQRVDVVVDGFYPGLVSSTSYVQFIKTVREYKSDLWPMADVLDDDKEILDLTTTADPVISSHYYDNESEQYIVTPASLSPDDVSIKNKFYLYPSSLNGSVDSISSYLIKPFEDIELEGRNFVGQYYGWGNGTQSTAPEAPGYYKIARGPNDRIDVTYSASPAELAKMSDKNRTTEYVFDVSIDFGLFSDNIDFLNILRARLPEWPTTFVPDNVYLCASVDQYCPLSSGDNPEGFTQKFIFSARRYADNLSFVESSRTLDVYSSVDPSDGFLYVQMSNFPDWYCINDALDTGSYDFYKKGTFDSALGASTIRTIRGIDSWPISFISNESDYKATAECAFISRFSIVDFSGTATRNASTRIRQLAIAFSKTVDTRKPYIYIHGRIYNDTWNGRKVSNNLIDNPVDMYEHVCRLQNWKTDGESDVDAGLGYSTYGAKINTSSTEDGGFDRNELSQAKDLRFSFQLNEYEQLRTPVLKDSLARAMFCIGHVDTEGRECLSYLPYTGTSSDVVTLDDVPEGAEIGRVKEPPVTSIYAEPFVRYNYNMASGEYDGLLGIESIEKGVWEAGFTPGFDGTEGEEMYNFAHERLWKRARVKNKPPSTMTDQRYISTKEDAKWFLNNWIRWQTCLRIEIPVYYNKARTWSVGRRVKLSLGHQTAGTMVECVIEKITKDMNNGTCALSLVMVDKVLDDALFYKGVLYTEAEGADADWKDTTTEYGDENDKKGIM